MSLVIGVGNPWRGDDAAGLEVARRAGGIQHEGDQAGLIEAWRDADDVAIVDAASSGAGAGTIHRFDASAGPLPARLFSSSTHAFGLAEAIELARALERLPRSLVVYAVEGESFEAGAGLSPEVERAVERLAGELGARACA